MLKTEGNMEDLNEDVVAKIKNGMEDSYGYNSLWTKILKSRYIKEGSFWEADTGTNPHGFGRGSFR